MRKLDLVGKKYITNDGYIIEVVEYEKASNILIKYEDGEQRKVQLKELVKGNIKKYVNRVGEKHLTNQGYEIEIIEYYDSKNSTIRFEDGQIYYNIEYGNIKKRTVSNKMHKTVYGVGFLGVGKFNAKEQGMTTKEYCIWSNIIRRCYDEKTQQKHPTYKDVTVCEEWHNFQNFAQWYEENYREGFHLDKDIFCRECKIYSPETCCFVPQEINNVINRFDRDIISNLPLGIGKRGRNYHIQISRSGKSYGEYGITTIDEAIKRYEYLKENEIKRLANLWKAYLDSRVYETLINFKFVINKTKKEKL